MRLITNKNRNKLKLAITIAVSSMMLCSNNISYSQQTSQSLFNFENMPSPSEYSQNKIENFIPEKNANSFFSPVEESQPSFDNTLERATEDVAVETLKKDTIENSIIETPKEDIVITPALEEILAVEEAETNEIIAEEKANEINLEGKTISGVKIAGIQSFDKDKILAVLNSKPGAKFNEQIVQKDLQKFYDSGYFKDNMTVEPVLNNDDTVNLEFNVEENIIVSDIKILGNTVIKTEELIPLVWRMKGAPQNLNEINKSLDSIVSKYHEKGYILAQISSVEDNSDGELNIYINEGVIDKIDISGNEKTKDYVITRNIITQAGTVYNEEYLKKDLAKIFSTQIFDEVNREITPSTINEGAYNLTVVVKEKSTDSISFGGGIDTGLGAFGSISFKEDNFLGKGQRLSLSGLIGSGVLLSDSSIKDHANYHLELGFVEPHFLNSDNSLMSKLYFRELGSFQVPLAIERRIGATVGVEHKVQGYENLTTNFMLGAENIHLKEGDFNAIAKLYNRYNLDIKDRAKQLSDGFFINLSPGIRYSTLTTDENPREGIIAQARFMESVGVSDFKHTNGRLNGSITKFIPVFKKSSLSLTAKGGAKIHGDDMPEVMAYRLGGPYSIRGFRMGGVGMGESFLMGSAELATPLPLTDRLKWDFIKKMRLTFFVDAGKVFDPTITSTLYDRPLHAITAGIGLRVHIPGIGPISVDYGIPITNPGSNGSENGYFTFGTGGLNGLYGYW